MIAAALIGPPSQRALIEEVASGTGSEFSWAIHLCNPWDGFPAPAPSALALVVLPVGGFDGTSRALVRHMALRCPTVVLAHAQHIGLIQEVSDDGIADFVVQPASQPEIRLRLRRALGFSGQALAPDPASPARHQLAARGIIGNSPAFLKEVAKLDRIAACDATVLVLGETGAGKEVFAQAIHYRSRRAGRPLVALNCGAIPNDLVEDELFGHIKGAYTTAQGARSGLVRQAEGGTLFLDDIDALPLSAQAKLLRFLQEREYRPVGSDTVLRADVRVIAASNRDLAAWSANGRFREDLFYRINVLSLTMPPLRERREDIATLALHFLHEFAGHQAHAVTGIAAAGLRKLLLHNWPGNVRELKHVIERAVLLARGPVLDEGDIDTGGAGPGEPAGESFRAMKARVIQSFERSYIESLLSSTQGNVTEAARAAKKNRRAFFELLRKHGISREPFRPRRDPA